MRPVASLFVEVEQQLERRNRVTALLRERLQQRLGAIHQAGLEEVLRKLEPRGLGLGRRQVGACQHRLVQTDRPVDLAAFAEQAAERGLQLHRAGFGRGGAA